MGRRRPRLPWSAAGIYAGSEGRDGGVEAISMEKVMCLVLGTTVIVASLSAGRSARAPLVARRADPRLADGRPR